MGTKATKLLIRFSKWSNKHLSHQQFLMILSAIIGFTAGLGAVVIKNLTHFTQRLLEGNLIANYHHAFYFIFPLIGLSLSLFVVKVILRKLWEIQKKIRYSLKFRRVHGISPGTP